MCLGSEVGCVGISSCDNNYCLIHRYQHGASLHFSGQWFCKVAENHSEWKMFTKCCLKKMLRYF